MAGVVFDLAEQHLLGLGARQTRDMLEHRGLFGVSGLELLGQRRRLSFSLEDLLVATL